MDKKIKKQTKRSKDSLVGKEVPQRKQMADGLKTQATNLVTKCRGEKL